MPAPAASERRPEIQALRALAVGSVLVFHLWPGRLPGGFVGVDVFFVISGFLITSHLLREVEQTGTIRVGRFWARRAKRLLPGALLVLLCVGVATVTLVPLSLRDDALEQILGSTFYVQNWVLAAHSVDYLQATAAASPVQHLWTLSVEEQFYVVLPLVVLLVGLLARRSGRPPRRPLLIALGLLALASLAYSIQLTHASPDVAYFSTGTRAWEFLAGSLLGFARLRPGGATHLDARRPRSTIYRWTASVVGLLLIAVALATYGPTTSFPGYAAGLPVLGALLSIGAGGVGLLALAARCRPVRFVGDVSYAIYLWHWPLVVIVPEATGHPLTPAQKVAIGVGSVLLAWLSTRLVEDPVRFSPRLLGGERRARAVGVVCLVGMLVVAGLALGATHLTNGREDRLEAVAARFLQTSEIRCLGAAAADRPQETCPDYGDQLTPAPAAAALDKQGLDPCWSAYGSSTPHICSVGPATGYTKRVFAVGDSHNLMYYAAYQHLADTLGWRIDITARGGCTWGTGAQRDANPTDGAECLAWKNAVNAYLDAAPAYDLILTTQLQTEPYVVPGPGENAHRATVESLEQAWQPQIDRGTLVVAIQDVPLARADVVQCVEREGVRATTACAYPKARALEGYNALSKAVSETPGSAQISFRDLMCGATTCSPVIDHVVVYRDHEHVTRTFAETLGPVMTHRIRDVLRRHDA